MATLRAVVLTIAFLTITLGLMPVQALMLALKMPQAKRFPGFYFKLQCRVLGIRVNTHGTVLRDRPVLLTSNHVSYFDIFVLGSLGRMSFISKAEVKSWPLFGWMAILNRSVFVERDRRAKTGEHRNMIQTRLADGDSLVLFPEGTSSDGNRVLPFKSALMGAAERAKSDKDGGAPPILVQPVSLTYTKLHGLPMGRHYRPFFAWYGDMDLAPHLWNAFKLGPIDVDVHLYPPVTLEEFGSRRALAQYCHAVVTAGVAHALSGRAGLAGPIFEEDEKPGAATARPSERRLPAPGGSQAQIAG